MLTGCVQPGDVQRQILRRAINCLQGNLNPLAAADGGAAMRVCSATTRHVDPEITETFGGFGQDVW